MPSTASVAMAAAIPESRMIGMPTTSATRAASAAAASAEGRNGYWCAARNSGSCRAKLLLKGRSVSQATP